MRGTFQKVVVERIYKAHCNDVITRQQQWHLAVIEMEQWIPEVPPQHVQEGGQSGTDVDVEAVIGTGWISFVPSTYV